MKAIVDCNSFYCSCERVFKPALKRKPVVVLSNNDGCIISISREAKMLGVKMATPHFEGKPLIEQHNISVFSSNYNLYGDLSRRVMDTLRSLFDEKCVEVYSVDEAFIDLTHIPLEQLNEVAFELKNTVELWTGIEVSVGVAPTKTLAKLANRIGKKNPEKYNGVTLLETPEKVATALQKTKVKDLWGIGHRKAVKLAEMGVCDAWQLKQMPDEWVRKNLGGVVGVRMIKELRGEESIVMDDPLENKKMITTTRMFGHRVTKLEDIKEAVATYTSRAAEKLRRQFCAAKELSVFVVAKQDESKEQEHFSHGEMQSAYIVLPAATSDTATLIKAAMGLVDRLFKQGGIYKKAGVIFSHLEPDESIQANLFLNPSSNNHRLLMNTLDNLNFSMRNDVVKFATAGTTKDWKMRQDLRSHDIPHVGKSYRSFTKLVSASKAKQSLAISRPLLSQDDCFFPTMP